MFRPLRKRLEVLWRHVLDDEGPSALDHGPGEMREISIGRHLLENGTKRRLGRVGARDFQSPELPMLLHHINGTPVGDTSERPARATVASVCS